MSLGYLIHLVNFTLVNAAQWEVETMGFQLAEPISFCCHSIAGMQAHEILLIEANTTHNKNNLYLTVIRDSNNRSPQDNGS